MREYILRHAPGNGTMFGPWSSYTGCCRHGAALVLSAWVSSKDMLPCAPGMERSLACGMLFCIVRWTGCGTFVSLNDQ